MNEGLRNEILRRSFSNSYHDRDRDIFTVWLKLKKTMAMESEDAKKVRLRRALSDEAGQQNEDLKRPAVLTSEEIRIIPRSRRDGTNWAASQLLEATACPDTHVFPMHLNGRLCYVTAPISVSIEEAMKAIQDAKDAQKGDPSLIMRIAPAVDKMQELLTRLSAFPNYLNEAPKPANKPKQKHDWYKFNQRNKYGK